MNGPHPRPLSRKQERGEGSGRARLASLCDATIDPLDRSLNPPLLTLNTPAD